MKKTAFIGLGNMGGPMAQNLLKAGHQLHVFDLQQAAIDQAVQHGAIGFSNAVEAVSQVDLVISMLPAGKHVLDLYLGENGIAKDLAKDSLIIDCSTIDSSASVQLAEQLRLLNLRVLDAPVSGGVGGAKAGTLTFIVGGSAYDFEEAKEVLSAMGTKLFHAGSHGAGQVAKICNNMLLSVLMAGTSEALQMAIDNGLDAKVMSDIMLQSSGRNWTLEVYNPCPNVLENVPSSNDYQGGFMVDLMNKDLGLAKDTALNSHSNTPMGDLARNLYSEHSLQGNGHRDFSSIFEMFADKNEKE
jgi:3-hydroxyisobutyrate dehydrogenase